MHCCRKKGWTVDCTGTVLPSALEAWRLTVQQLAASAAA